VQNIQADYVIFNVVLYNSCTLPVLLYNSAIGPSTQDKHLSISVVGRQLAAGWSSVRWLNCEHAVYFCLRTAQDWMMTPGLTFW